MNIVEFKCLEIKRRKSN